MQKVFRFLAVKIQAIIKPLKMGQGTRHKGQGRAKQSGFEEGSRKQNKKRLIFLLLSGQNVGR
jgi:hypothetical protein